MLHQITKKVFSGKRITGDEGLWLIKNAELLDLVPLAEYWRQRHNPNNDVSYVIDTNLNYTNLCDAYCSFCAFYRTDPNDPSAYTYTVDQIMDKIERARKNGVRTVLMQGGLNSELQLDYYVEMVAQTKKRFPDVTPHYWSAPEIVRMSEVSEMSYEQVFTALWDAGQRSMPGGGSEILSNEVKATVSRFKPKDTVDQWTKVHEAAHRVGLKTTATMMYGHVEKDHHIIESLEHIRGVQDLALNNGNDGGFTAFIPWSYKKDNTALAKMVDSEAGPNQYLRIIAISRIMLDNIPHIQASWFSEGKKTGQIALRFGADDFGGTLFDENVMLAAGFYNRTTENEVREMISEAGYSPVQRLTNYELVEGSKSELASTR